MPIQSLNKYEEKNYVNTQSYWSYLAHNDKDSPGWVEVHTFLFC